MNDDYGPEDFQRDTGVSRETLDKLEGYAALLRRWQPKVNLVGNRTLPALWRRHFLDSAQLAPLIDEYAPSSPRCLDLGAGAGFPGMVLAVMGIGNWTLVESDQRKIAFLAELSRTSKVSVTLRCERIEAMDPLPIDVITARALAPLDQLLALVQPLATERSLCLFLKGRRHAGELEKARKNWTFDAQSCPSLSDPDSRILLIKGRIYEH